MARKTLARTLLVYLIKMLVNVFCSFIIMYWLNFVEMIRNLIYTCNTVQWYIKIRKTADNSLLLNNIQLQIEVSYHTFTASPTKSTERTFNLNQFLVRQMLLTTKRFLNIFRSINWKLTFLYCNSLMYILYKHFLKKRGNRLTSICNWKLLRK